MEEISSKRCRHWVSPALYLPNVTGVSKVHLPGKNKETEWLAEAALSDGTAHQKRECVYVGGSGQITPPFPVAFQEGDPFSDITHVRFGALMLVPYPPASWALYINVYINMNVGWRERSEGLLHMSATFWSGGRWAQSHSPQEVRVGEKRAERNVRLQKVHLAHRCRPCSCPQVNCYQMPVQH